ncbi:sulfatase-like hydrolase/transferase [Aristaeella hokkaidonensis]|uniref:Uncharacterized protein n=1 Tax=Aristaeella hokkaidonensis TaxID=3046382 RepID=A0AC61N7R5_9FIRM|nr:sulfatase-like hydrolase/transferase [Aristaeella hokkaidonensis]QUC66671.1 hypothetical protein JYE49_12565 [Aristaeella hokkaidonensis]
MGSEEFWFSFNEILLPFAVLIVASLIIILGLLMVLPTKGYHVVMAIIIAVSALLLLQALFLPNDYGSLNGEVIDWSQYSGRLVYNTAIWIVVIVGAVFWAFRNWQSFRKVMQFTAVILLVLQTAILVTAGITHPEDHGEAAAKEVYLTTEDLYTVSSDRNTIVFILDAFDSQLMCDLIEEHPEEIKSSFEDFTFYHNTNGGATRTKFAIPYILTGKTNDNGGSYMNYLAESFQKAPLFQELRKGHYHSGIYTEYGYVDCSQTEAIDNLSSGGQMKAVSQWGLCQSLMKMVLFKQAAHILKPVFWMYSFELAQWRGGNGNTEAVPYKLNDIQFYQHLQTEGISAEKKEPVFRFVHMMGAHGPYTMNEDIQKIPHEQGSIKQQGLGSLRIIAEYIKQLKMLDVYDRTNIFVLADHGNREYVHPSYEQNPLLMVREAGKSKPFSISEIRLSFQDLSAMLAESLKSVPNIEEKYQTEGTRYFYVGSTTNNGYTITEYASEGNAYDTDSYYLTGKVYSPAEENSTDYKLGEEILFGDRYGAPAQRYMINGFSYIDPDYVWSSEKEVEFGFKLGDIKDNLLLTIEYHAVMNGFQRCYLYADDQMIGSFSTTKADVRKFIIPGECVKEGMLNIRMDLPDCYNPVTHGTGVDNRNLGLGFYSIQIDSTDEVYEPEKQLTIHKYDLGQEIVFGKDGNMSDYAIGGISEDHWTSGKKAWIQLEEVSADTALTLIMEYNTYKDQQHVIICANGEQIADYTAVGSEQKEMVIPQALLKNGSLTLEINLPDARKPDNGDQRELGLWMRRIVLRKAEEKKE